MSANGLLAVFLKANILSLKFRAVPLVVTNKKSPYYRVVVHYIMSLVSMKSAAILAL